MSQIITTDHNGERISYFAIPSTDNLGVNCPTMAVVIIALLLIINSFLQLEFRLPVSKLAGPRRQSAVTRPMPGD
jgi:hypothetical protein